MSNLMKFDPATGAERPYPSHPEQYRQWHGTVAWLFDPYTGGPRDARDIGSDTFGLLLLPAGVPLAAAADPKQPRFTVNSDGTVTDHVLKLRWTQATVAKSIDADAADKAIAELSATRGETWRLPTVEELMTLPDRSRHDPAIDTSIFPDTESAYYWTGTPCSWNASAVWVVGFGDGFVYSLHRRHGGACLRAVSALPAGQ